MTRAEAKQAFYDRVPVEIHITSLGWVPHKYIDQLIYSRPAGAYADRTLPSDMSVRAVDMTGQSVTVCRLENIRKVYK